MSSVFGSFVLPQHKITKKKTRPPFFGVETQLRITFIIHNSKEAEMRSNCAITANGVCKVR